MHTLCWRENDCKLSRLRKIVTLSSNSKTRKREVSLVSLSIRTRRSRLPSSVALRVRSSTWSILSQSSTLYSCLRRTPTWLQWLGALLVSQTLAIRQRSRCSFIRRSMTPRVSQEMWSESDTAPVRNHSLQLTKIWMMTSFNSYATLTSLKIRMITETTSRLRQLSSCWVRIPITSQVIWRGCRSSSRIRFKASPARITSVRSLRPKEV